MDTAQLPALLRQEIASLLDPVFQQRLRLISPSLAYCVQEVCSKGGCVPFQVKCESVDPMPQPLLTDELSQELVYLPCPVNEAQLESIDTDANKVIIVVDCEACSKVPNNFQPVERVGTGLILLQQSFRQFRITCLLLKQSHLITEIADFVFLFLETAEEIASVEDVISWSRPENAATIPLIYAHPRPSTLFPNVTTVGRGFLMGFGGETLDIEELFGTSGVLTNVDEMLLSNSLVRRVRIGAAFRNLTSFPLSFLAGCSRLTTVDWSAAELSNITEISRCFCMGTALESFTFPKSLSNVRSIGELFLARCKHLTVVDMRAVAPVVTSLGACFLQGCVKLRIGLPA